MRLLRRRRILRGLCLASSSCALCLGRKLRGAFDCVTLALVDEMDFKYEKPPVRVTSNGVFYVEPLDLMQSRIFWKEITRTRKAMESLTECVKLPLSARD